MSEAQTAPARDEIEPGDLVDFDEADQVQVRRLADERALAVFAIRGPARIARPAREATVEVAAGKLMRVPLSGGPPGLVRPVIGYGVAVNDDREGNLWRILEVHASEQSARTAFAGFTDEVLERRQTAARSRRDEPPVPLKTGERRRCPGRRAEDQLTTPHPDTRFCLVCARYH